MRLVQSRAQCSRGQLGIRVSRTRGLVPRFEVAANVSRRNFEPIGQSGSAPGYVNSESLFNPH
jgi:hypothetical protein